MMMMTYRLLCALLVLALCCCPFVHAGDTQELTEGQANAKDPNLSPPSADSKAAVPKGDAAGRAPSGTGEIPGNGKAEAAKNSSTEPTAEKIERETPGLAVSEPKVNTEPHKSLTENAKGNKGSEIGTGTPAEKEVNNAETSAQTTTTTTTTKAPTTTTTTTTEAPSTTTTEAPAVSTTSAPSRLREIDGSLSSSAWVCAPLVLAASALAYTTVG
ncbi:putative mucin TcMUCII [Trypanosoma cruzi]|uniref:Mucin TcMUCII, putative n=2 Tax=Trypanosoma cruzi TaxID=5693 RepID=Q4DN53_TRYCC|nr:mucin TcMUCII, putative [Trypanosoma cruzi]EAN93961.1 mucin TcMUCII, putative [Trypanosoma cruzi]PWV14071.1 putative mucin TcMUCII [Trypanosoma cruzi]|eukprot:XP_815812.1 mucin TcMUCII [Trypanosoma cruzi strain CL Brener]